MWVLLVKDIADVIKVTNQLTLKKRDYLGRILVPQVLEKRKRRQRRQSKRCSK